MVPLRQGPGPEARGGGATVPRHWDLGRTEAPVGSARMAHLGIRSRTQNADPFTEYFLFCFKEI